MADRDRISEAVTRLVTAEVRDVERMPQDAREERPVGMFVWHAHADEERVKRTRVGAAVVI